MSARHVRLIALAAAVVLAGCSAGSPGEKPPQDAAVPEVAAVAGEPSPAAANLLPGMPPPVSGTDVYAGARELSPAVADHLPRVYVPNSKSDTVTVIDPATFRVVDTYSTHGDEPQHVVPAYDMQTLYATNDLPIGGGSLLPIDPRTGRAGDPLPVRDPYNMYFTPDGRYALVVAEADKSLDLYDPHTWQRVGAVPVPDCAGVDHLDFTADGRFALASCEFAGRMAVLDVGALRLVRMVELPGGSHGMPQDVKLSPDGATFFVADMMADGVYTVDAKSFEVTGHLPTGRGAHGLYVTRDSRQLIITNRGEGSLSVWDFAAGRLVRKWELPGGGSPDMGNLSADGRIFWVAGRYHDEVYAIDIVDWKLLARIPVGRGPHGLTVWPQPGRYSTGHTGVMR
ncbi:beta-propeller fold lactonase family protein [Nocardia blacklockiae]|uniref:YVTN family beta-propeller repeat protein n=1 Tax=Nocardia blacklockiae TaxID=480036 RepID=UPI0018953382|nr:beta-propeller fold lactonase family protein [Nocardia blacklockiae]MBF6172473.1 beta-propeller fold lactonase family protein [Nocardia blacklockiae]